MNKMQIVGITGRSGSGKSSLAAYYASLGYPVADGDAISRQVCEPGSPCLAELVGAFGAEILAPDGSLLRKKLGEMAFATPEGNQRLISITHPYIVEEFLRRADLARQSGSQLFFADGAMIINGPFEAYCDKIILVVTQQRLSVSRIILRDNISKTAVYNRLHAQLPEEVLRAAADYIIENNGTQEQLWEKAKDVLRDLLSERRG